MGELFGPAATMKNGCADQSLLGGAWAVAANPEKLVMKKSATRTMSIPTLIFTDIAKNYYRPPCSRAFPAYSWLQRQ